MPPYTQCVEGLITCVFPIGSSHEENLPTAQSPSPTASRLPQAHAYARRTSRHPSPSREGTPATRGLIAVAPAMRRENRLRSRSGFRTTVGAGQRVTRPEFVLYHFAREAPEPPRVGLRVNRRIGSAVVRNKVRRRLREALRPLIPRLGACDIVVVARPAVVELGVQDLERALDETAARAGLLRQ